MTVYSIGLLQGYLPNGVDNAQGYRERFFNDLGLNNYVSTHLMTPFNK